MEEIEIIDRKIKYLNNRIDNIDAVVSRYMRIKRKKIFRKVLYVPKNLIVNTYSLVSKK